MSDIHSFSLSGDVIPEEEYIKDFRESFRKRYMSAKQKPGLIKQADFFADAPEDKLESAFNSLAEQRLFTRVPMLSSYYLGFQMLKKNDSATRAAGIFAFKVGKELLYVPVFLIDGELLGQELLYIVSEDRYVPSNEKNINDIISKSHTEVGTLTDNKDDDGESILRSTHNRAGLKLSSFETPELPESVVRDACKRLFKEAAFADVAGSLRYKYAVGGLGIDKLLSDSFRSYKCASLWSDKYPIYQRLIETCLEKPLNSYGEYWNKKAELAKKYGIRPARKITSFEEFMPQKAVKFAEFVSVTPLNEVPIEHFKLINEEHIGDIYRKGYLVSDTRSREKLAALIDGGEKVNIQSPDKAGIYKVFMPDGTYERCLVLNVFDQYDDKYNGSDDKLFVLSLSSKKACFRKSIDIIVDSDSYEENWFDKLPSSVPETTGDKKGEPRMFGHPYTDKFLISPTGYCWQNNECEETDGAFITPDGVISVLPNISNFVNLDKQNRYARLYADSSKVYAAPSGTVLKVYECGRDHSLALGSFEKWMSLILNNSVALKVRKRDKLSGRYSVDGLPEMKRAEAVEYVMTKHFLSEKSAEYIFDSADKCFPNDFTVRRTKKAQAVPQEEENIPFPEKPKSFNSLLGIAEDEPIETESVFDRDYYELQDSDVEPKAQEVQLPQAPTKADLDNALQASETGSKEFVSSHMLMNLLREVDDGEIISKYVGVFEKAVDAFGRLYMQLLWKIDEFKERFGDVEFDNFRDQIKNLFEQLGDFVIYLKKRDINPAPTLSINSVSEDNEENFNNTDE